RQEPQGDGAAPRPPRPSREAQASAFRAAGRAVPRSRRFRSSSSRRRSAVVSSLELPPHLDEAARDAARDRAGRQVENLADRPVALVAGEEAVEEIRARIAEGRQRLPDVQREIELREGLGCAELDVLRRLDAGALAQAVDAQIPRELREPRTDGG